MPKYTLLFSTCKGFMALAAGRMNLSRYPSQNNITLCDVIFMDWVTK